ncbi:DNA mismatch endonuclease Vsr [candidate division WOR-3 bacterium]|nr:DNA mismatch endonuclease Vsr [candidate division WOR-3 bacterium]
MSQVHSTGSKAERAVFNWLQKKGYKFTTHSKNLPGKPDVVLADRKTVIFVHGCFWHHHRNCPASELPQSNRDYWLRKIKKNSIRDKRNAARLRRMGWHVFTVWECQVNRNVDKAMRRIEKRLYQSNVCHEI